MQESVYVQDMYLSDDSVKNIHDLKDSQTSKNFYWDSTVVSMEEDEMESYFILDELGSPIELMDEDGFIRESYSYDEFGRMYTDESHQETTPLQPFGFTGYQMDEAGGLYYAQARRYDAANGRFVSKDSDRYIRFSIPDSLNQYMYCYDSPLRYVDPSGNDCYYFYLIEWTHEAEADRKELAEYYGIDESQIHLIEVNDTQDLIDGWNNMGTENGQPVDIDAVVFNTHAHPHGFSFGDYGGVSKFEVSDMDDINIKDVDTFIMYGCNAGHSDYMDDGIVREFSEKVTNDPIVASDGTVSAREREGLPGYTYYSDNDEHFSGLSKTTRDNEGWLIYQYYNGNLEKFGSVGYDVGVITMLEFAHNLWEEVCFAKFLEKYRLEYRIIPFTINKINKE